MDVLKEILATTEGLDAEAPDDDLDAWWGTVEIDRLASGLTLAAIEKLSEPGHGDDSSGPPGMSPRSLPRTAGQP